MVTITKEKIHISQIKSGDTIIHEGFMRTVSGNNIKRCLFMGKTIFGDNYTRITN